MRAENLLKSEVASYTCGEHHGTYVVDVDADDVSRQVKESYTSLLQKVKQHQADPSYKNIPGFILHSDIVYKVAPSTGEAIKITGAEAKQIKKQLRQIAEGITT